MSKTTDALLERIETYFDAAPRTAAEPEEFGKFTLFRPTGKWRYYARPRLGLDEPIDRSDVDALRARQRELKLPEQIEWVMQTTPSLASAVRQSGLTLHEYPLLVLADLNAAQSEPPVGVEIRVVDADDDDFALPHAVAHVGFGASGTKVGSEGPSERDAMAVAMKSDVLDFLRDRARGGFSISYAAFDETGPIAIGTHQPVGDATELVGIATLPSARRRGIGAAVTAALVADALSRGIGLVFLSAGSEDVARVYERVGFTRVGMAGAAELPE